MSDDFVQRRFGPRNELILGGLRSGKSRCAERRAAPVSIVSNGIGLGISPLTREPRRFVDELGRLRQAVAETCADVTLMVAGIELPVKREFK
jgi:adenosyl cobinamide kinase/adenosyl cobinamide phosphate guanylyltransferase